MEILTGSVERTTFYNPENGYSVLRLRPDQGNLPAANRAGLVTVTGNLPEVSPGEHLRLQGRWLQHPKHGLQFQAEVCEQSTPATAAGVQRYLASGLIKGIGPRLAEAIVDRFGAETLDIIDHQPERLLEVPDIGPVRTRKIIQAWEAQKHIKEIMLFLHSHQVSTNLAIKIYKQYDDQALSVVREDPYRLAVDIYGVGFKTADRIARSLGLAPDHPSRLEAGLLYALNQRIDDGHVYTPQQDLIEETAALLEVQAELITPALSRLDQQGLVRLDAMPSPEEPGSGPTQPGAADEGQDHRGARAAAVYLTPFYHGERGAAQGLRALAYALPSRLSDVPPAFIALDPELSPGQVQAIQKALAHPVSVLTGGPGTGKTTCIRALIAALETAGKRAALCAPTGRAAKRLSEATGRPASTIHRLLGFSPREGFSRNRESPLKVDFLVVDEASMLDILLAHHLLKALEPGTHLLLVGDVDQLPSVGAGDVLRDVIASGLAPVTRLDVIFRQAVGSLIITNAHRINQGQMPHFPVRGDGEPGPPQGDFFLFPAQTAEEAADWVQDLVCERIPENFGLAPGQIQVLAPMYRGPAGVIALNTRLQERLNPGSPLKPERSLYGQVFRPGDRVMQTQNDYDKDVYNGDIGQVLAFSPLDQTLTIDFDGRSVVFDWAEADQLTLAYAISVHKAQGAEFPAVVVPLLTQHYLMLQRNLLYTAVTRAQRLCVLVGNHRAIGIAVRNDQVTRRHTALDRRLAEPAS